MPAPASTPLALRSTASALADRIRDEIVDGTLAPGAALAQEQLSARFGVSRSPLREALRQLESEGWIVYRPNRGAYVATLEAQDVRDFYQVRRILEAGAIRLALPRLDARRLDEARRADASMRGASAIDELVAVHKQFHSTIYAAAANPKLEEAIGAYYVRVQRGPKLAAHVKRIQRCSRADHAALLDACARRDRRAAERVTLEHLDHLEAIVLDALG